MPLRGNLEVVRRFVTARDSGDAETVQNQPSGGWRLGVRTCVFVDGIQSPDFMKERIRERWESLPVDIVTVYGDMEDATNGGRGGCSHRHQ